MEPASIVINNKADPTGQKDRYDNTAKIVFEKTKHLIGSTHWTPRFLDGPDILPQLKHVGF